MMTAIRSRTDADLITEGIKLANRVINGTANRGQRIELEGIKQVIAERGLKRPQPIVSMQEAARGHNMEGGHFCRRRTFSNR